MSAQLEKMQRVQIVATIWAALYSRPELQKDYVPEFVDADGKALTFDEHCIVRAREIAKKIARDVK